MITNKPNVEAYLVTRIKGQGYGKPRRVIDAEDYDVTLDSFFAPGAKENYIIEPLIPLSTYEVLRDENETLLRDVSALVEALEAVMEFGCDRKSNRGRWALEKTESALAAYRKKGGES